MNPQLAAQLERLSRFGETRDADEADHSKRMLNITPDTGRLLWILIRANEARRVLEIGTSNAYSTIWLADAVAELDGSVVTLERLPEKIALSEEQLDEAGLRDRVEIVEGDAADTLRALEGEFDLIFLDADRASYVGYLPLVVERLRTGGLLVTDNVTSHPDEVAAFLDAVRADPRLATVTVPIGKGEELTVKL